MKYQSVMQCEVMRGLTFGVIIGLSNFFGFATKLMQNDALCQKVFTIISN